LARIKHLTIVNFSLFSEQINTFYKREKDFGKGCKKVVGTCGQLVHNI